MGSDRLWWGTGLAVFEDLLGQETDECVLWVNTLDARGYGQVRLDNRLQYVHRAACIRRHGDTPFPKAVAAHSCRNRNCMNYRHLRWATQAENCADTVKDGNSTRGIRNAHTKLTEDAVRDIRARRQAGESGFSVAERYDIARQYVYAIDRRRVWAWLV